MLIKSLLRRSPVQYEQRDEQNLCVIDDGDIRPSKRGRFGRGATHREHEHDRLKVLEEQLRTRRGRHQSADSGVGRQSRAYSEVPADGPADEDEQRDNADGDLL